MAVACREFDISRKTGYKIFERYKDKDCVPSTTMFRKAVGHIISCKDASRLVSRREEAPLTAWQAMRQYRQ
jgi:hypothetical protein